MSKAQAQHKWHSVSGFLHSAAARSELIDVQTGRPARPGLSPARPSKLRAGPLVPAGCADGPGPGARAVFLCRVAWLARGTPSGSGGPSPAPRGREAAAGGGGRRAARLVPVEVGWPWKPSGAPEHCCGGGAGRVGLHSRSLRRQAGRVVLAQIHRDATIQGGVAEQEKRSSAGGGVEEKGSVADASGDDGRPQTRVTRRSPWAQPRHLAAAGRSERGKVHGLDVASAPWMKPSALHQAGQPRARVCAQRIGVAAG
jgi:hypothetical protein